MTSMFHPCHPLTLTPFPQVTRGGSVGEALGGFSPQRPGLTPNFTLSFTPPDGLTVTFEAVVVLAVVLGCYLLACWVWPYTRCPACQGGKSRSPSGRAWRDCWRCRGRGKRIRWGARLFGKRL